MTCSTNPMFLFHCLGRTKGSIQARGTDIRFLNKTSFYGEELLAPCPTPKLLDNPLSAVRGCLFNIFAATIHIEGRSSICNLRTSLAVVKERHLSWIILFIILNIQYMTFESVIPRL